CAPPTATPRLATWPPTSSCGSPTSRWRLSVSRSRRACAAGAAAAAPRWRPRPAPSSSRPPPRGAPPPRSPAPTTADGRRAHRPPATAAGGGRPRPAAPRKGRGAGGQRDRPRRNFALAREAVDKLLTRVSDDLEDTPQTEPLRRGLLLDALAFHGRFVAEG